MMGCVSGATKYGAEAPAPRPSAPTADITSASSTTRSEPDFFVVEPNPICCTCPGNGLMVEKGNSHLLPCVDCGMSLCYSCVYCGDLLDNQENIWCAKWGKWKSPWLVCEQHVRR